MGAGVVSGRNSLNQSFNTLFSTSNQYGQENVETNTTRHNIPDMIVMTSCQHDVIGLNFE